MPGDYEFTTLRQEIEKGATLEEMEYHWIHPDADLLLQKGLDENSDSKLQAISCINTDPAGLERFMELFAPDPDTFTVDSPYCSFPYTVQGQTVELVFRMNRAGLSKLKADWLRLQKERLDSGMWLTLPDGTPGKLEAVVFDLSHAAALIWRPEQGEPFPVLLDENGCPKEPQEEPDMPDPKEFETEY